MNPKKATNFIFELGQLKRQIHSGLQLAGVEVPDSVAEHAFRAAQLGYILAIMEGNPNPEKVATMLLVHDNAESRISDQNKIAARYYSVAEGERKAFAEQLNGLDPKILDRWTRYFNAYENRSTPEGIIAKDADILETAFQAKEYSDYGYKGADDWIKNAEGALHTKSAKKLMEIMKKTKATDWWKGLKVKLK